MPLDLRPPIASALVAFGVDATVTPPGAAAVSTRVIWHAPNTVEVGDGDLQRREMRRVLTVPASDVAKLPRETLIKAPESKGQTVRDWKVDSSERLDYDHHRAFVVPA